MKTSMLRWASRIAGVTRNEAMVSVAVVLLVLAVAFPAYRSLALRWVRTEAQDYMQQMATYQHQLLAQRQRLETDLASAAIPAPRLASSAYDFELKRDAQLAGAFEIVATPKGFQLAEACGELRVDYRGHKTPQRPGCWQ